MDVADRTRRPFRVVGHSRSGTGYMAKLFQAHGYDVRHEEVGADGVSSWQFAAQGARRLPYHYTNQESPSAFAFDFTVHVIRAPLECIASLYYTESQNQDWSTPEAFRAQFIGLRREAPKMARAVESWVNWNRLIDSQAPDVVIRVEDAIDALPLWLQKIGLATKTCRELPPTDYNTRPHPPLTLAAIESQVPADLFAEFTIAARKYGYEHAEAAR